MVMTESGFTEEQVFDLGISGELVFLVVVPELGACRVPDVALSHFMAGADSFAADNMPEHYSGALSGPWVVKRDRLRILADTWDKDRLPAGTALDDLPFCFTGAAPAQTPTTPAPVVTDSDVKPWLAIDEQDPAPAQPWYTPARYFARQLTIEKPTLLANRELLADKVSTALFNAGFKKRGGKERFDSGTVKKALVNVTLG
jgi:hypothetical protein